MEGQKRWVEEDAIVIDEEDGQGEFCGFCGGFIACLLTHASDAPDTHRLHPRSSSMTLAPPLPDPTFNPPADSHALPNTLHRYHSESSTGDPESGSTSQQRSPSLSSPPPPPSFFNPPADIPPVPLDLLSPPVLGRIVHQQLIRAITNHAIESRSVPRGFSRASQTICQRRPVVASPPPGHQSLAKGVVGLCQSGTRVSRQLLLVERRA